MRRIIFSYAFYLLPILLCIQSCKKTEHYQEQIVAAVDSASIKEIKSWFENEKNASGKMKQKLIDSTFNRIDWTSFHAADDNERQFTFYKFKAEGADKPTNDQKIVISRNKKNKIQNISIIILEQKSDESDDRWAQKAASILSANNDDYNGELTLLTISQNLICEYGFNKGKVTRISTLEKDPKATGSKVAGCINWFLITTYYYTDGTTSTTEEYLFTTCDDECQSTRIVLNTAVKINCSGGGGGDGTPLYNPLAQDRLCPSTFRNFTAITSNNMSYGLNVYGLNFNDNQGHINSFDAWVNVQNYIQDESMNKPQSTALPGFLPPGLEYHTPMQIIQSVPSLNQLLLDGDIRYGYNQASNEVGWSFNIHAYSVISALAADWAATNTYRFSPNPAINATAPGTFITQFNGILRSILPGSAVSEYTRGGSSSFAVYSRSGACN